MTDEAALELALITLEHDELKVGNIYVNYKIKETLIKLIKKKLEKKRKKKEWVGLTKEETTELQKWVSELVFEVEQALKEKNT